MRRLSLVLGSLLALSAFAMGSPDHAPTERVTQASIKVAFGWVKNSDGTKRSIKGLEVPVFVEKIKATKISRKKRTPREVLFQTPFDELWASLQPNALGRLGQPRFENMMSTAIYTADAGFGYAVLDPAEYEDPSSLDDLTLQNGSGKKWDTLTFGVDVGTPNVVRTFRFRCYSSYNPSAPAGTSAFGGEFKDWGFHSGPQFQLNFPTPGTYKITIPVALFNIVAPSNNCYMAQQMRFPNGTPFLNYIDDNGEGAFDPSYRNVYNTASGPSVGSSSNGFWYDWNPLDGIYSEDEFEVVSLEPNIFSNHLRSITVDEGIVDIRKPTSVTVAQGFLTSPSEESIDRIMDSDDWWVTGTPQFDLDRGTPPLQVVMQGTAVNINATSITFQIEVGSSSSGGSQTVSLYNFQTGAWVEMNTRAISQADTTVSVSPASNPTHYINQSNRQIRARIAFFPPANASRNWAAKLDFAEWAITRP